MSKLENIKELYEQIEGKTDFIVDVANHFKRSPQSLRTNWFSSFWSIPEQFQEELITIMQNKIKLQN